MSRSQMWGRRAALALGALAILAAVVCVAACSVTKQGNKPSEAAIGGLELLERLPKEPLAVWVAGMEDPLAGFNEMLDFIELLGVDSLEGAQGPSVEQRMRALDEALGISVREDLLAHVGSEMAVALDVQGIDPLVAGAAGGRPDLPKALGGSGIVFLVTDEEAVERSLEAVFEKAGATMEQAGDVRVARFALRLPLPQQRSPGAEPPSAPVYFGVRNDAAAIGLSEGWVRGALDGLPEPRRLAAGADFQKVFAPLDERPKALSYLNLPRLRRVIESSNMLRMVLSSNVQARRMMEVFFTEEGMGVGIGQTIVELEDGARTTTFGPEWMAGGPKMIGLVAATVMQNAVEGLGRGRPPLPQREGAP